MTLRKRYLRNIMKNKSFYICAILLTTFIGVLYLGFAANASKFKKEIDDYYKDKCIEDGQFTVVDEISDEDISSLEKQYDIVLERQKYIDYEKNDKTIRILSDMKKINKTIFIKGQEPKKDGEIIINTCYMKKNKINANDKISIFDKKYTVLGDMERPDYLFMIKDTSDTFAIKDKFGIAIVSDETFKSIEEEKGLTGVYYSIIYNKNNANDVRININEKYHMLSYLKADSNTRITTLPLEIEKTVNMFNIIIPVFVFFIGIIIAVVLGRKIKNERKQIGVLLALGYKKRSIAIHYTFYGVMVSFIGGLLGILGGPLDRKSTRLNSSHT